MIRLSITLDCWKNSCQGATVVPTMAMIRSIEVELKPPATPGVTEALRIGPTCGWLRMASGIAMKFVTTNTYMNRSQRRKLPVMVMAISARRPSEPRCTC